MGYVACMVKMRITLGISGGNLKDHIDRTYGENCYIEMRCMKLVENLELECEKRWRINDNLMKFLPEKRRISELAERCRSHCVQRLTATSHYML